MWVLNATSCSFDLPEIMRKLPRLPALTALRAFEAAARLGSVTAAATELSVTQGAISRQIRLLEEDLQQPLFRRLHRGIELTAGGQKLSASLTDAFVQIGHAVGDLKRPTDVVSVKAAPTFAIRWLLPRLAEFRRIHPGVKLEVSTAWHDVDLAKEDFDCGITGCGEPAVRNPQYIWVELVKEAILPVCTPAYARKMGAPHTAADFARHTLLHPTPDRSDWRMWMEGWGGGRFDVRHHRSRDPRGRDRARCRDRRAVPAGGPDRAWAAHHAGADRGSGRTLQLVRLPGQHCRTAGGAGVPRLAGGGSGQDQGMGDRLAGAQPAQAADRARGQQSLRSM
jgi:DNA-binding transcriptional LysR family regulator